MTMTTHSHKAWINKGGHVSIHKHRSHQGSAQEIEQLGGCHHKRLPLQQRLKT